MSGNSPIILPRVIRLRDCPAYLGMDINRFNAEVRPNLIEIPIGTQGIGFDRLDLDEWFDDYKSRNGRPGKALKEEGRWAKRYHQDSSSVAARGISTRQSQVKEFEKVVEQALSKKQNAT